MTIYKLSFYAVLLCLVACGGGGGGGGSGSSGDSGDSASSSSSSSSASSNSSSSSSSGNAGSEREEAIIGSLSIELLADGQSFMVKGRSQSANEGITLQLPANDGVSVSEILVNGVPLELPSDVDGATSGNGGFRIQEASSEPEEIFAPLDPGLNTVEITVSDELGAETTTTTTFINEGLFGGSSAGNVMLDEAGNRLLIIESNNIYEVDLTTKYRRMLRNPEGVPLWIEGIGAYKASDNQVFYFSYPEDVPVWTAVLRRLDLDTGIDEAVSTLTNTDIGSGTILDTVIDLAYNPVSDVVYVAGHDASDPDAGYNVIIAVDPGTGNRTIITGSSDTNPDVGTGNLFFGVGAIAWDATGNRLLAAASNSRLFEIDVSNGDRTTITAYDPPVGSGASFGIVSPASLAYDPVQNRALLVAMMSVGADLSYSLFSIDMESGDRTVLSNMRYDAGTGPGFFEKGVRGLALDAANQKGYAVVDDLYALLEIDLTTGDRQMLSSGIGDGPHLTRPQHGRLDEAGRRLLVADRLKPALMAVNIDNGERSIISGAGVGTGTDFEAPTAVDINAAGTIAYVLDEHLDCVFEVDLSNGNRTVISGNGAGSGQELVLFMDHDNAEPVPPDMVFDEARQRLLIVTSNTNDNSAADVIWAVDVSTGERSVVAADLANDAPRAISLEIDRLGNRLFIAIAHRLLSGDFRPQILEMDLETDSVGVLISFEDTFSYMHFHDLALSPDNNTLYVMNNHDHFFRQIHVVDLVTSELIQGSMQRHKFSNQHTTIETGFSNDAVYMFDHMSGAVMLMQINPVTGSTHFHEYEGVIISQ